ncbi:MAG: hypothetical protein ACYTEL_00240 [Planctomycetota bacterium]|jgi:hypothetical protein
MDDFELRLKSVPLAKPPTEMKTRIFGPEPDRPMLVDIFRFRVPVAWAAVFALFTGLAGMYLSQWLRPPTPTLPAQTITVQIMKSPSDRNIFDFTEPAADFLPGELTLRVQEPKEI